MLAESAGGRPKSKGTSEGGLAMPATTRQTHAATDQWVVLVVLAAWLITLLSGLLVLG
jgi:hypothetical protein